MPRVRLGVAAPHSLHLMSDSKRGMTGIPDRIGEQKKNMHAFGLWIAS
jgi:hypothetical protein